ncbi:hypothetical protein IWZ01DRAFT_352783 [Phyllosticta capitalensis]
MHASAGNNKCKDRQDRRRTQRVGWIGRDGTRRQAGTDACTTHALTPTRLRCLLLAGSLAHFPSPSLAFRFSMLPVVASSLFIPCFCLLAPPCPLLLPTILFHTYFFHTPPHTPSFLFPGVFCISISRSRARFVFSITACIRSPMFSLLPSSHPIASCLHQSWSVITSSLLFLHSIITLVCLTSFLLQSPSPLPISRYPTFLFFSLVFRASNKCFWAKAKDGRKFLLSRRASPPYRVYGYLGIWLLVRDLISVARALKDFFRIFDAGVCPPFDCFVERERVCGGRQWVILPCSSFCLILRLRLPRHHCLCVHMGRGRRRRLR